MYRLSVIVPNYCGEALLARYLPAAINALPGVPVTVVDDASTDDSVDLLKSSFPQVQVIARADNGGFSAAVNDGIRATEGELVLLLNNDVEVAPGLLDPILPIFDDADVFAVSPRIVVPGLGGLDDGAKRAFWHHGMLYADHAQGVPQVSPVFFASGSAVVYRRSMLAALEGFDEAYSPFYWEDADLSYRAWKRGWKSLYQPASQVIHQHSATVSRIRKGYTEAIKARNCLLFIWRNVEDKHMIREHRRWIPLVLAKRLSCRDWAFASGWRQALARRIEARAARDRDSRHRVLSDREIFGITGVKT